MASVPNESEFLPCFLFPLLSWYSIRAISCDHLSNKMDNISIKKTLYCILMLIDFSFVLVFAHLCRYEFTHFPVLWIHFFIDCRMVYCLWCVLAYWAKWLQLNMIYAINVNVIHWSIGFGGFWTNRILFLHFRVSWNLGPFEKWSTTKNVNNHSNDGHTVWPIRLWV